MSQKLLNHDAMSPLLLIPNAINVVTCAVPDILNLRLDRAAGHVGKALGNAMGFAAELIGFHYVFDWVVLGAEEAGHMIHGVAEIAGVVAPSIQTFLLTTPMVEVVAVGIGLAILGSALYAMSDRLLHNPQAKESGDAKASPSKHAGHGLGMQPGKS